MRFSFDARKSARLRANPKRGIGFEEAQERFPDLTGSTSALMSRNSIWPLAGWANDCFPSYSKAGTTTKAKSCIWLRYGVRQRRRFDCMKKTHKTGKPVSADAIARMADRGENVSGFFTGKGRMVQAGVDAVSAARGIQRVNVDLTAGMLEELDKAARDLNVSRQAVIKTLVRQALDQHYLAQGARRPLTSR
jgi:Ribbon-helix-helix protein, copG family